MAINAQVTNAPITAAQAPVTATKKSPLELMVMQHAMAQNSDPNTMMGLALGRLLRGLFDDWKERYDARGLLNRMAEMDENKRAEILANLAKYNPTQYQRTQEYLAKKGGTWDTWQNPPQPAPQTADTTALVSQTPPTSDLSGINLNARARQPNLLGDTDFWKQRVTTPENNWNQWSDVFKRVRW